MTTGAAQCLAAAAQPAVGVSVQQHRLLARHCTRQGGGEGGGCEQPRPPIRRICDPLTQRARAPWVASRMDSGVF